MLKLEQQKLKNDRKKGFEVEMAKEMNQLRSRLREVMRENEELRDNVRYLKEESRVKEDSEDGRR